MLLSRRFENLFSCSLIPDVIGVASLIRCRRRSCELQNYVVSPFVCPVSRYDSRTISESIPIPIDTPLFRIRQTDRRYSGLLKGDQFRWLGNAIVTGVPPDTEPGKNRITRIDNTVSIPAVLRFIIDC